LAGAIEQVGKDQIWHGKRPREVSGAGSAPRLSVSRAMTAWGMARSSATFASTGRSRSVTNRADQVFSGLQIQGADR